MDKEDFRLKLKNVANKEKKSTSTQPNQVSQKEIDILQKEELENLKQDRRLRLEYAKKLFWMVCVWLALILGIVISQGLDLINISDSVLITLITTTTANVAAYFLVVTKYLFPNK